MTTLIFEVKNVPAALYKAMGGFATNGVNMTKLESYMVDGEFAATRFLVDVDGHPEQPALARALEELRFFSKEVEILGVYPAAAFRVTNIRAFEYGDWVQQGKTTCPSLMTPTIFSARFCAEKSPRIRSMRTSTRSRSWT